MGIRLPIVEVFSLWEGIRISIVGVFSLWEGIRLPIVFSIMEEVMAPREELF